MGTKNYTKILLTTERYLNLNKNDSNKFVKIALPTNKYKYNIYCDEDR